MTTRATSRHRASVRPEYATVVTHHRGHRADERPRSWWSGDRDVLRTRGHDGPAGAGRHRMPQARRRPRHRLPRQRPQRPRAPPSRAPRSPQRRPSSAGAPLTAPAAATVTFETGAFTAVPKPKPPAGSPTTPARRARRPRARQSVELRDAAASPAPRAPRCSPSRRATSASPYRLRRHHARRRLGLLRGRPLHLPAARLELPRTANQQMLASTRISRSRPRPGDLVFIVSGGRATTWASTRATAYMYDAGSSGKSFSKREIWTSNVVFGRV